MAHTGQGHAPAAGGAVGAGGNKQQLVSEFDSLRGMGIAFKGYIAELSNMENLTKCTNSLYAVGARSVIAEYMPIVANAEHALGCKFSLYESDKAKGIDPKCYNMKRFSETAAALDELVNKTLAPGSKRYKEIMEGLAVTPAYPNCALMPKFNEALAILHKYKAKFDYIVQNSPSASSKNLKYASFRAPGVGPLAAPVVVEPLVVEPRASYQRRGNVAQ